MSEQTWQRLQSLFHAALTRPIEERQHYLETACGGDEGLLQEASGLLAAASDKDPGLQRAVLRSVRHFVRA